MALLCGVRAGVAPPTLARAFHVSAASQAKPRRQRNRNNPFALSAMKHFQYDDIPTHGHMKLQKQRQLLEYYRLLQNELPQLKQFHEPFEPAPASHILNFQFTHYQGEAHPGARKVVLNVDIKDLFGANVLKTPAAKHKFLLLAGARWQAPNFAAVQTLNDALASGSDALAKAYESQPLGSLKISCSANPHESQNMKWCSDVLDRMIAEAQVCRTTNAGRADLWRYSAGRASLHQVGGARRPHAHAEHCRLPERVALG